MVGLGCAEPNFCHCWLCWGRSAAKFQLGRGALTPKQPSAPCPGAPLTGTVPSLDIPEAGAPPGQAGREAGGGAKRLRPCCKPLGISIKSYSLKVLAGGGGAHILGATFRVLSCQCQPRWGRLGLGVTLFPPPAVPLLTPPSTWGGADSSVMEWAGMQESSQRLGCTGRGVRVTPPTCSQTLVLGGGRTHSGVGGVNGPCPSPQIDHVAQFSRLPVASLLFILSGTRAGDL